MRSQYSSHEVRVAVTVSARVKNLHRDTVGSVSPKPQALEISFGAVSLHSASAQAFSTWCWESFFLQMVLLCVNQNQISRYTHTQN
jgi:hypothetical protein